jgi:hypothetical protein
MLVCRQALYGPNNQKQHRSFRNSYFKVGPWLCRNFIFLCLMSEVMYDDVIAFPGWKVSEVGVISS